MIENLSLIKRLKGRGINTREDSNNALKWSVLCCTVVCVLVLAQTIQAQPSSTLVFRFHDQAKVLYNVESQPDSYIIALNKYRRTNNVWAPREYRRHKGMLARYTLELPRRYGTEDAFQFYVQQLPELAQPLYECKKRQCGESNNWANKHFLIKQLYGLDNDQYYGVWQWSDTGDQVRQYAVIYTVRRGNGRLYTQLELFRESTSSDTSAISVIKTISDQP